MTDMELVSLCAVAMALFNLYLMHQIKQAGRATQMAWEILIDVAKGDIALVWDEKNKTIKPVKPEGKA